jgi:rfaE bifunctional protein kinase chain/domain
MLSKKKSEINPEKIIVFVSGDFNILHPGHLRLLKFASECGDYLVVGVNAQNLESHYVPAHLRLENIKAIKIIDHAVLLTETATEFIKELKPNYVIKGKEYESKANPEAEALLEYGGKLIFCSGDTTFTSLYVGRKEFAVEAGISFSMPNEYLERNGINRSNLLETIAKIKEKTVLVIGDLILDQYIACDPIGMSQEDASVVVTPLHDEIFLGGAGIVAAHVKGMGANVFYIGLIGDDEQAVIARKKLHEANIENAILITDPTRPTTLKARYRADRKTLLRVSYLKKHEISEELSERIFLEIIKLSKYPDLVIFSDFNYGCLPQNLVDRVIDFCCKNGIIYVADSQSSSQVGDVSRFKGAYLITPTEHEARIAINDYQSGLPVVAEKLMDKSQCKNLIITLGNEGAMVHCKDPNGCLISDLIPAINMNPQDVSGAGDSFLTLASLALLNGANIWVASYLGSTAAALQVSRVGNRQLILDDLMWYIKP